LTQALRALAEGDLDAIAAIYATHTGAPPPAPWRQSVGTLLGENARSAVALVVTAGEAVIGYLIGQVRSWEFGSEAAGWILALGVAREHEGCGVARSLLEAALPRFRALGVDTVRTMVKRDDVAVLRFFRDGGFVAGPYTELELGLTE